MFFVVKLNLRDWLNLSSTAIRFAYTPCRVDVIDGRNLSKRSIVL